MAYRWKHLRFALVFAPFLFASPSRAEVNYRDPVDVVSANKIAVAGAEGQGLLPFYANRSLDSPNPDVERAVIVIHGRLRNAGTYFQSAVGALEASGEARRRTLLIAPQFLAEVDGEARTGLEGVLRWSLSGWESGEDAKAPAPISSFEALDFLLHRLSDTALFPGLRTVVIAGHSAGGQVVQRYAILETPEAELARHGIHLRYVVANSSSYAYFDELRPTGAGRFARFSAATCPGFNRWRYGMEDLPHYAAKEGPGEAEQHYIRRDVVYLLGTLDTDPNHRALDKSCMAEAQGAERLARGDAYFAYLKQRHPHDLAHRLVHVPAVGHNGDRMLTSECGMAVLFDRPGCGSTN